MNVFCNFSCLLCNAVGIDKEVGKKFHGSQKFTKSLFQKFIVYGLLMISVITSTSNTSIFIMTAVMGSKAIVRTFIQSLFTASTQ